MVGGARPNFMKIAPIYRRMKESLDFRPVIVHTGQHYDRNMSQFFFRDLGLPRPDVYLGVGSASQAAQTARIMVEFEKVCLKAKPDLVLVVGDVNSTLACSIVASKLLIPVAHVEAGLRSRDRAMPEEINRIVTDSVSDYLFTTCRDADENLLKEGVPPARIFFVGNVMIDTLLGFREKAKRSKVLERLNLKKGAYSVLTLHRPSNVDDSKTLRGIMRALKKISGKIPIVFPAHPRTEKMLRGYKFAGDALSYIKPLGYLDFLFLMMNSRFVLTDSGGIQEETTVLKIPCVTLRKNTERPITVKEGTNILAGVGESKIVAAVEKILSGNVKSPRRPKYWDGKASWRIIRCLAGL